MYTEHYTVSEKRWQEYVRFKLDAMLKAVETQLVGFQYSKVADGMSIILFWR